MKDILLLLAHLLTTIAKFLGPGGARAIVADSLQSNAAYCKASSSSSSERSARSDMCKADRGNRLRWHVYLDARRVP